MIKVFDMFAGYGGAEFALKKAGIEHECIGFSEINKYAIQCFEQNHNGRCYGDCTKINVDELPNFDLLTGGFPCQDVSIAGKRDLSRGRTNLYKEVLRIAEAKKPKYMLLENVKGLLSISKDRNLRDIIINDLNKIGYDVCFKLLNSRNYGIPQNRERVWFVCKLGKWKFGEFKFPNEKPLNLFIYDLLESYPNQKYFLSSKQIEAINKSKFNDRKPVKGKVCGTLKIGGDVKCIVLNSHNFSKKCNPIIHSLYPRSSKSNKGVTGHLFKQDNTSYCLDTGNSQAIELNDTVRRLTPKECFRLIGFVNDEININGISDSQCYRLAGNGWDINLVSLIFKEMFKGDLNE